MKAWLTLVLVAGTAWADEPANLLVNGGFEDWAPLAPGVASRQDVRNVDLSPPGQGPVGWLPMRELTRDQTRTGRISLDETIRHGGQRSVRLENGDPRDITVLYYSTEPFVGHPDDPHNIKPSRRYRIRWWVKGENVVPAGAGPILMLFYYSRRGGHDTRTDTYEIGVELPKGTFDWQRREFTFITDDAARWLGFSLQLRWSTGTVWYDDVEMVDLGPVVTVETY
jgi:hypothetical protein